MKNSNDTIGNQTHDLPACSAVPQPTAPPRAQKQSHYRPGQALRVPGVSQISRQSAHEGGKVVSPTQQPPLPPREYSWYSFLRPEGLCQ